MTKTTKYDPRAERKNAARALAHANTAASTLLDALQEALRPAHGADWGHVGDAHHLVQQLLHAYASATGADSGDQITLPVDGGRDGQMTFTLEGF